MFLFVNLSQFEIVYILFLILSLHYHFLKLRIYDKKVNTAKLDRYVWLFTKHVRD